MRPLACGLALVLLTVGSAHHLAAQDPALVEALAPLLRAEDQKVFEGARFESAALHPDPLVRRTAALAIGRIGDPAGSAILVRLLVDREPTVLPDVFFALGLLHDTTTVTAIITRLKSPDSLTSDAVGEAATALIRLGTPTAAAFVESVLKSPIDLTRDRRDAFVSSALLDAWKLGARLSAEALVPFTNDTSVDLRWRALYSLGRSRAPAGGAVLLRAATDPSAILREAAVKALTRRMVDTAGLALSNVQNVIMRDLDDVSPGVRINALVAAGTFGDSLYSPRAVSLLGDPDPNVRVMAAEALGQLKGSMAVKGLTEAYDRRDATWALRRAILLSLSRLDTTAFAGRVTSWGQSADVRDRLVALSGWGAVRGVSPQRFLAALKDPEPAVEAAAIAGWGNAAPRGDSLFLAAVRARLGDANPLIRAAAASALGSSATLADLDPLLAAWRLSQRDLEPDARMALLRLLHDLARRVPEARVRLEDPTAIGGLTRPDDALLRREAERSWPAVAAQWGPVGAFATGRSLEDYRGIVRTLMLAPANPHVTIETGNRGTIDIELLARDAPLTVANFLRLVDRHYFDGIHWHRVVPNFVVQAGDPTDTGEGGPGWSIRDEINRWRYELPMLGMALSGPDTGGSQWFINVSSQPHLDGIYTIFGRVTGSYNTLHRVVQGDLIRTIHR